MIVKIACSQAAIEKHSHIRRAAAAQCPSKFRKIVAVQKYQFCQLFNILTDRVTYPDKPFERITTLYPNRHVNTTQLSVPFTRTNNFKNSFFPSTTALWNSLNCDISPINSLASFKHALIKNLF